LKDPAGEKTIFLSISGFTC